MKSAQIIWWFCVLTAGPAYADIIQNDREIDWSYAGAKTDFASRTTICATLDPVAGSDDVQIQNAIASCPSGQVVKLNAGTFDISDEIHWGSGNNDVTLRGSGVDVTVIKGNAAMTTGLQGSMIDLYSSRSPGVDYDWGETSGLGESSLTISSGATKGSTQLVTGSAHGYSVGDYILIDQTNQTTETPQWHTGATWLTRASGTKLKAQTVRVTNVVNTTTFDFTPPLYWPYAHSSARVQRAGGHILKGISIEDLTIDNTDSGAAILIIAYQLYDARFHNLKLKHLPNLSSSFMLKLVDACEITISHSRFGVETVRYDTNGGYGMFLGYNVCNNLIVDNAYDHLILAGALEGNATGNVFAYNYTTYPHWHQGDNRFGFISHGAGSMNLIEGNLSRGRLREDSDPDSAGASGNLNTYLRNRYEQNQGTGTHTVYTTGHVATAANDQLSTVDFEIHHHSINLIGNVFGTASHEAYYQATTHTTPEASSTSVTLYRLGYTSPYDDDQLGNDALVYSTMARHGNWTSLTAGGGAAGVTWETSNTNVADFTDQTIPNSLYYTSKPDFFGSCTWPWIIPTGATDGDRVKILPAKDRYDGNTTCDAGGGSSSGSHPSGGRKISPMINLRRGS